MTPQGETVGLFRVVLNTRIWPCSFFEIFSYMPHDNNVFPPSTDIWIYYFWKLHQIQATKSTRIGGFMQITVGFDGLKLSLKAPTGKIPHWLFFLSQKLATGMTFSSPSDIVYKGYKKNMLGNNHKWYFKDPLALRWHYEAWLP